jgi:hypothetical protein
MHVREALEEIVRGALGLVELAGMDEVDGGVVGSCFANRVTRPYTSGLDGAFSKERSLSNSLDKDACVSALLPLSSLTSKLRRVREYSTCADYRGGLPTWRRNPRRTRYSRPVVFACASSVTRTGEAMHRCFANPEAMRFWNHPVHTKRIETERATRGFIDCTP